MPSELIEMFRQKFESLAGKVYVVTDSAQTIEKICEILEEVSGRQVALGILPGDIREPFLARCRQDGVGVIAPPYSGENLTGTIDEANCGITSADFAIAETGTLVETTTDDTVRLVSALPRVHIALLRAEDIVPTLESAASRLREAFQRHNGACAVTFISGPSRTGDIEMKLVLGVHGPEAAHAIIIDAGNRPDV
ncbi:MAG: lactate utilization protein [Candidatus Hydrogenedentes bacterium]|nr:lactate utilization protein [Candidatus Hydrogenedentota bacterium]